MPGFGSILGAFGQAYPQFQQQQTQEQMKQMQIKQALQEMANSQQDRTAQGDALKQFSTMQGAGPGGSITPQQYAAAAGGNGKAFDMLRMAANPYNTGQFNLQGRQISGENALDRTALAGENAMQRVTAQQEGANQRNTASNEARQNIVGQQQEGANKRNQNTVAGAAARISNRPQNITATPEYKTADRMAREANQQMLAIETNYSRLGDKVGYLKDPQWVQANEAYKSAVKARSAIQSKAAETTQTSPATQGPPKIASDEEYNQLPPGSSFFGPDGILRQKPQQ